MNLADQIQNAKNLETQGNWRKTVLTRRSTLAITRSDLAVGDRIARKMRRRAKGEALHIGSERDLQRVRENYERERERSLVALKPLGGDGGVFNVFLARVSDDRLYPHRWIW